MEIQDSVSKDYSVHDYKKANVQRIDTYNFPVFSFLQKNYRPV